MPDSFQAGGGTSSSDVLHMLTYEGRNSWMAEHLLQQRMWVDAGDYKALNACIENGAVGVAKLLLDRGMDFECYRQMYPYSGSDETIRELGEHWQTLQEQRQETGAPIEAQRSGFDGERSRSGMSEPCPQGGESDMELAATMGGMTFG